MKNGIENCAAKPGDIILIHNAANPGVSTEEITSLLKSVKQRGASIVARPVTSTVKKVENQKIIKTLDRSKIYLAETPQAAFFENFQKAYAQAELPEFTDSASVFEAAEMPVYIVPASKKNTKITYSEDLQKFQPHPNGYLVGIGSDSHHYSAEKGMSLGGLYLPESPKFQAESDGDVMLHAAFNAISSAIGERSLGFYATPMCKQGVKDSSEYLKVILQKMHKSGYDINNISLMLEGRQPKIEPISQQLKMSIAKILQIQPSQVGIAATTGEELSEFGKGNGLKCQAVVSLISFDD